MPEVYKLFYNKILLFLIDNLTKLGFSKNWKFSILN
jgi:hypothetical protein